MKMSAKKSSLVAQVLAALWVAGWSAYKFIRCDSEIEIFDIILSGIAAAGCFCPVFISIFFDKLKELKDFKR